MTGSLLWLVIGWLWAINIAAYLAFYFDKQAAIRHDRRISERVLLTLALFGGSLGAKAAQRVFRHKTRKHPFATLLDIIIFGQFALGLLVLFGPSLN
ncbi:MAG: DUF1294 domain-containing protein [Rhodobacteraceae bacterium]|nr:DUF1294 domain-containing protein [Paracoccaceae bacterium]